MNGEELVLFLKKSDLMPHFNEVEFATEYLGDDDEKILSFTYDEFKNRFGEHSFIPECNEIKLDLKDEYMVFSFDDDKKSVFNLKLVLDIWFKLSPYEKGKYLLKKGTTFEYGEYTFIDFYKDYFFFFVENPEYGSPYCVPVHVEDTKLLCEFCFDNGVRLIYKEY